MAKLKAEVLLREFNYNGVRIPDPAPQMSVEQVRDLLTPTFPEIATATLTGPEDTGTTCATPSAAPSDRRGEPCPRPQCRKKNWWSCSQEGRRTASGSQSHSGEASPMQRILRSRTRSLRSHEPACGGGKPSAPDAAGSASTAGIATLAPAFGQALPSLADVRAEYSHEVNAELVYELCAALVREGLGDCGDLEAIWRQRASFAQHAMMSGIGAGTRRSASAQCRVSP
jgi:PRTRC genetic system protein C